MIDDVLFAIGGWVVIALVMHMFGLHDDPDSESSAKAALLRALPAFSLALVVHFWVKTLTTPETDHARALVQSLFSGILYVVLAIAFIPVVSRLHRRLGHTRADGLLGVVFFCGFVFPAWIQDTNREDADTARASAARSFGDLQVELRTAWLDDIRAAGAHGPAGVAPPMLGVETTSNGIQISNLAGRDLCVYVGRLRPAGPEGRTSHCDFDQLVGAHRCAILRASARLNLSRRHGDCTTMPLEFRIGNVEHDEVGWWSDSAMTDFEAETKHRQANGWWTADYSDDQLRQEIARLTALVGDAERADRWREDVEFWASLR